MFCDKCQQLIKQQLEKQKQQMEIITQQLLFLKGTVTVLEFLLRGDENGNEISATSITEN
jgi:hypothetical protein